MVLKLILVVFAVESVSLPCSILKSFKIACDFIDYLVIFFFPIYSFGNSCIEIEFMCRTIYPLRLTVQFMTFSIFTVVQTPPQSVLGHFHPPKRSGASSDHIYSPEEMFPSPWQPLISFSLYRLVSSGHFVQMESGSVYGLSLCCDV